ISIGPGFYTRLDAEVIIAANFGGVSALVPLTIDQIYSRGVLGSRRFYAGLGIGPYFGEVTRFGGTVFIGADVVRNFCAEFTVHFPGFGPALTALQLRYSL
ncbi:hypothetical protein G3V69_22805, partial [Escherichia coli]|nr:hypothetical protein [Escherichia coli]